MGAQDNQPFDFKIEAIDQAPFRIPAVYLPPLGGPLRWQDEQSGVLPGAVMAYFNHRQVPSQTKIVVEYLRYYIHAPCWDNNPYHDAVSRAELAVMRSRIVTIQAGSLADEREIEQWIADCLEIGIDPL